MEPNKHQVNSPDLFRVLSDDQIRRIYEGTLQVLEKTGVRVYLDRAVGLLREAGCEVSDGNLVRIPPSLVEDAIASAPSTINIANRRAEPAMVVGDNNVYYGPGEGPTYYLDPRTSERRPFCLEDARTVAILCDALPNIDFLMGLGMISDVTPGTSDLYEFETMLTNSSKPLVAWAHSAENMKCMYEMCLGVAGGEAAFLAHPFLIFNAQPCSPLYHTKEAVEKLLFASEKGVPIIYTPSPTAGGTAPVTLAGLLVNSLAENLSGVVISQAVRRGSPIIVGGGVSVMDMGTTILCYGAPELALASAGLVEIARHLGLPRATTGGCTDSKVMDSQAALDATFNLLVAGISATNLVRDIGYFESAMTGSPELVVLANEIISMVKRIARGIQVDDETLALDVIHKAGPGGNFLTEAHTLKNFRKEVWYPRLLDRRPYSRWVAEGSLTLGQRLNMMTRETLEKHSPEPLEPSIRRTLDGILARGVKNAGKP